MIPRAVLLIAMAAGWAADTAVAHPSVAASVMGTDLARRILVGLTTTWPDGQPVIVILVEDAAGNEAVQRLSGRDAGRLLRAWKRLVFAGAGALPRTAATTASALALVAVTPGSIAFIAGPVPAGAEVRTLTVVPGS